MKIISESNNYLIMNEYENVFLKIKKTSQMIFIGDFYGDPEIALISANEKYCIIGGAGVIIYYLNEPFEEYKYAPSEQWKDWGRGDLDSTTWVNNIVLLDHDHIEIETEDEQKVILDVY